MKTAFESERLLFRELLPSHAAAMFELDSDPEVCKYLGFKSFISIEESRNVIENIRQQYLDNGIGRWAAILKDTGEFIGWAGLKFIKRLNDRDDNYDLGYRFIQRHWGKGYGTESAKAFIDFGFNEMKLGKISAYVDVNNIASQKILEKCGFKFTNNFIDEGDLCGWYELENPNPKIQ
ncbi:MAG TPA: GNAT family N-acetyltransferase [Flavobacterium sp.]|nr:GNAT family N-acetyltransferase [Flavobacterium sp.]